MWSGSTRKDLFIIPIRTGWVAWRQNLRQNICLLHKVLIWNCPAFCQNLPEIYNCSLRRHRHTLNPRERVRELRQASSTAGQGGVSTVNFHLYMRMAALFILQVGEFFFHRSLSKVIVKDYQNIWFLSFFGLRWITIVIIFAKQDIWEQEEEALCGPGAFGWTGHTSPWGAAQSDGESNCAAQLWSSP